MESKYTLALILVLVIVGLLLYVSFNYDTMFNHDINITFPDGCIEVYKNGELTTPVCEDGRNIRDQQIKELAPEEWNKIHNLT